MDRSTVVSLMAAAAMISVLALGTFQILVKHRNPESVLLLWALSVAVIAAISVPLINPDVSVAPLFGEIAGALVVGLLLAGGIRLVNYWKTRR